MLLYLFYTEADACKIQVRRSTGLCVGRSSFCASTAMKIKNRDDIHVTSSTRRCLSTGLSPAAQKQRWKMWSELFKISDEQQENYFQFAVSCKYSSCWNWTDEALAIIPFSWYVQISETRERLCLLICLIFADGHVELDVTFGTYGLSDLLWAPLILVACKSFCEENLGCLPVTLWKHLLSLNSHNLHRPIQGQLGALVCVQWCH